MLYLAGEDINAGDTTVISSIDGKVYRAGPVPGTLLGNAVEQIRKGLRISEKDGRVREYDA